VLAAVLVGASVAAWQARVALAEKRRAEEVKDLIAAVFREADPTQGQGKVLSAAELLRQAERRLHARSDANAGTQVELLAIIGESLFGLQEHADSARVIEQALHLQESAGIADDVLTARLHLVLSQTYELLGRNDDARRELDRAFAALAASGNTASGVFVQAKLHQAALGIVFSDFALAERAAHEAISVASATISPNSAEVATALQRLSHVYTLTERREQALEPARRSFKLLLGLHASDVTRPQVIESMVFYAQALHAGGHFEEAFDMYRDALAKSISVFGEGSRSVGESLSSLVPLEIEVGALKPAIEHARRAIDIYLKEGKAGSATHGGPAPQAGQRPAGCEIGRRSRRAARRGGPRFRCRQI
jgi:tetratricopeptide (TPR) repeat protein